LTSDDGDAVIVTALDTSILEEMNPSICLRHRQVFCGKVVRSLNNQDPMTRFSKVFSTNTTSTATTNDQDIRLDDFRLRSRRELDETVVKTFAWFPMHRCSRKSKYLTEGGT
jgi:hypothetical protein